MNKENIRNVIEKGTRVRLFSDRPNFSISSKGIVKVFGMESKKTLSEENKEKVLGAFEEIYSDSFMSGINKSPIGELWKLDEIPEVDKKLADYIGLVIDIYDVLGKEFKEEFQTIMFKFKCILKISYQEAYRDSRPLEDIYPETMKVLGERFYGLTKVEICHHGN